MRISRPAIFFILILLISAMLRLWQLGSVPISPDWDEAALGYNAYSILRTGKDEYGVFIPTILRSFNDYKPALYAYLIIPFIPLFGLSVFTVRLPSALFGIATVGLVYFLVKELFYAFTSLRYIRSGNAKSKYTTGNYAEHLALLTAFLLAISPWHIQFSRIAFESNAGLGLNLLMVFSFLRGLRYPRYLYISVLSAVGALYTYQSEKVFTPLILFGLIVIFRNNILQLKKKQIITLVILGCLTLSPMLYNTLTDKEAFSRARGVSIFSQRTELLKNSSLRLLQDRNNNDLAGLMLDNWRIEYTKIIIGNYLAHYNPVWLFITGDYENNRHHAPEMGLEYLIFLPFLLIGIYALIFGDYDKRLKFFILYWFLITPIPAAITIDVPHAVRTLNFLPVIQLFIALGLLTVYLNLKKHWLNDSKNNELISGYVRFTLSAIFVILFFLNFSYYLNQYFVQQNYEYAYDWQYGYKEIVDYIKPVRHKYKKIIVSDNGVMMQSYMFFLFYLQYDPRQYISEGGTVTGGIAEGGNRFANFEFRTFNYYQEQAGTLFIGAPGDFPEVFKLIHTVHYPDGNPAIKVVEK